MKYMIIFVFLLYAISMFSQTSTVVSYEIVPRAASTVTSADGYDFSGIIDQTRMGAQKINCELRFNPSGAIFSVFGDDEQFPEAATAKILLRLHGTYFFDKKTEKYGMQLTKADKLINLLDTFQITWKINQSVCKDILGYNCYFAEGYYYVYSFKRKKNIKYQLSAWFTPGLPVSYGPREYRGLPGLVLAGKLNKSFDIVATSIKTVDSPPDFSILAKGIDITRVDYERKLSQ